MTENGTTTSFLLPPGASRLTGARAGEGWVLCWDEDRIDAWSPENDWISLPSPGGTVEEAYPVEFGMVVRTSNADQVGFWKYGKNEWAWLSTDARWEAATTRVVLPRLAILFKWDMTNEVRICSISQTGMTHIQKLKVDSCGAFFSAWEDKATGKLMLLFGNGLYSTELTSRTGNFKREKKLAIENLSSGFDMNPAICVEQVVFIPDTGPGSQSVHQLDLETGEISSTGLGWLEGCTSLWSAYGANDRNLVREILDLQMATPRERFAIGWKELDLFFHEGRPYATISTSGIYIPETTRNPLESPEENDPFASPEAEVLSWQLWLSPEEHLPHAFDSLTRFLFTKELLIEAIVKAKGQDACRALFEHVRGKEIPFGIEFEGIRELFGKFGAVLSDLVRESLNEKDPYIKLLGCIAAGTLESVPDEDSFLEDKAFVDLPQSTLWDEDNPVPSKILIELLGDENVDIKKAALDTCSGLRLQGVAPILAKMFTENDFEIRLEAVKALARLPDVSDSICKLVEKTALEDRDENVREEAVKALGPLFRGPETIDVLIRVLGDVKFSPRSTVEDVLERHFEDITMEQIYRIGDIVWLLLMLGHLADDPTDFTLGIDTLFKRLLGHFTEPFNSVSDFLEEPEHVRKKFLIASLLHIFQLAAMEDEELDLILSDEDDITEFLQVLNGGMEGGPLSREDILPLMGHPLSFLNLARFAEKFSRIDRHAAQRLALITCFAVPGESLQEAQSVNTEMETQNHVPLHLRLRNLSKGKEPVQVCWEMVREISGESGIAGLTALFTLAKQGDEEAKKEIEKKILTGQFDGWNIILPGYLLLLNKQEQCKFASGFISSEKAPRHLRMWILSDWDEDEQGPLDDNAKKLLFQSCALDKSLSVDERIDAAQEIANMGDTRTLENLWTSLEKEGKIDQDNRYRFSRDMAICGHARYMDEVRGQWSERGDLEALKAFARCGNQDDIVEIEAALEEGAPEELIRETVQAIRARLETP